MTIDQYHKEFQLFMDKVDSQALPEFLPKEIDILLHEAEVRTVKQAYGPNNIYKAGFQEVQKRTDDLNTLVKTVEISADINSNSFTLPEDYLFYLRSRIKVTNERIPEVYTGVSLVRLDHLNEVLSDPFNKSRISEPVIYFTDGKIFADTNDDAFKVTRLMLTYLKYPKRVDRLNGVSSELPEEKQREALQLAVRIALGSIESPRVAEQNQQLGTVE